MPKNDVTPDAQTGYAICPGCQSEDITGWGFDVYGETANQETSCDLCECTWTNEYSFTGFTVDGKREEE